MLFVVNLLNVYYAQSLLCLSGLRRAADGVVAELDGVPGSSIELTSDIDFDLVTETHMLKTGPCR